MLPINFKTPRFAINSYSDRPALTPKTLHDAKVPSRINSDKYATQPQPVERSRTKNRWHIRKSNSRCVHTKMARNRILQAVDIRSGQILPLGTIASNCAYFCCLDRTRSPKVTLYKSNSLDLSTDNRKAISRNIHIYLLWSYML